MTGRCVLLGWQGILALTWISNGGMRQGCLGGGKPALPLYHSKIFIFMLLGQTYLLFPSECPALSLGLKAWETETWKLAVYKKISPIDVDELP